MQLFPDPQANLDYPLPLSEKYRPRRIRDFIGLTKERKILSAFVSRPRDAAFLFVGPSGLGKTTMALAMAEELGAELHLIPSQKCTVENLNDTIRMCWNVPLHFGDTKAGGKHLVLVDEADAMTEKAQLACLSFLDSAARPPDTVFVFTANQTNGLEKRFLSRTMVLEFSSYGMRSELAEFLAQVWQKEIGHSSDLPEAKHPDFERMAKDATNNVRDALMRLEVELLAA